MIKFYRLSEVINQNLRIDRLRKKTATKMISQRNEMEIVMIKMGKRNLVAVVRVRHPGKKIG